MDGVRRTTTLRQTELLVEFAETHRDLALGRLRSKEARALAVRLWRECAGILNCEGPARTHKEWAKIWNDTKCRVKAKAAATVSRRTTGGGPATTLTLTALEERVAMIIGHDVGPMPKVAQGPLRRSNGNNGMHLSPTIETPASSLQPSSVATTLRWRRLRMRQRANVPRTGTSRVRAPAPTRRDVLDESRAMVLRIEESRARTDNTLAQAALIQAEAAKTQAEASLLQSQAVATFCQALSNLMPSVRLFLEGKTEQ